ncbi:hypothetical protein BD811P3_00008 [Bifidobacterium phage BD811P3]|nr:hypothetical protein BD811P3_00008 [Bifidobacterium phage BD811P3]
MSRKQRHVKARQAAQARAARNIKQLGSYSHTNLAKTADQQIVNIAKTLGQEWERQKEQTIKEAKATPYHATAAERPTKKDFMFAERPDITDAQIAAEPIAKRRKLLRQQQRKINAARRKINNWNLDKAMPPRSIYEQRMDELHGTTDEGFGRNQIIPSKLTDFLQMTNVLGDEAFVRAQLESGHRKELLEQMHDAAEILGLRTERKTGTGKRPKTKSRDLYDKGDWPSYMDKGRYEMFEKILGASLGTKRLKRFRKLTAAQKRAFIELTDAPRIVFDWTTYDPVRHGFVSSFREDSEGYRRSRSNFDRWMAEVEVLA